MRIEVERLLKQAERDLRNADRFAPERVIAFESRARGEALRSSDLDLLVVTPAFQRIPWLERAVMVQEAIGAPFAMDILGYTPEEFERKPGEFSVVGTAVAEGVELDSAA